MQKYNKELTPVIYGPSSIKVLHYDIALNKGCFRTHWHDRVEILRIKRGEIFVGYDNNIRKFIMKQKFVRRIFLQFMTAERNFKRYPMNGSWWSAWINPGDGGGCQGLAGTDRGNL